MTTQLEIRANAKGTYLGATVMLGTLVFSVQAVRHPRYNSEGRLWYHHELQGCHHWAGTNVSQPAATVVALLNAWSWPTVDPDKDCEDEDTADWFGAEEVPEDEEHWIDDTNLPE